MVSRVSRRCPRRQPDRSFTKRRLLLEALEDRRLLASIVVNSADSGTTAPDDGIVTLRDAIAEANRTPDVVDTITFDESITEIANQGVTFNSPVIVDGAGRVVVSGGFTNQALWDFRNHSGSTVTGFTFSVRGGGTAIELDRGADHLIIGNRFERQNVGFGQRVGIEVRGTQGATIGGTEPGQANLFFDLGTGIHITDSSRVDDGVPASDTKIVGNFVGVDEAGNELGNSIGITVGDSLGTVIERNTISGNSTSVVLQDVSRTATLTGNRIGLAPNSDTAVRNFSPVVVDGSFHVIEDNVIAGNTFAAGIEIIGSDNEVKNNRIGTNQDGTVAIPNFVGILISPGGSFSATASNNVIGPGNLISGNSGDAIMLEISETNREGVPNGTIIIGNTIGLSAAHDFALPNSTGIVLRGVTGTRIGGPNAGDGNVIAGNLSHGISVGAGRSVDESGFFIDVSSDNTTIQGNLIGTATANASPIGNERDGIRLEDGAGQVLVGSLDITEGNFSNLIIGNDEHGIRIPTVGSHQILGNQLHGNGQQDLDTGPLGPNQIDDPNADGITNSPVVTEIREGSTFVSVNLVGIVPGLAILQYFNAEDGRFLHSKQVEITSESTVNDVRVSDQTFADVQVTLTQNGQTSELSRQQRPEADLLIKGGYEREILFGGNDVFDLNSNDSVQIETLPLPVNLAATQPSQQTEYRFDIALENQTEEESQLRLVAQNSLNDVNGASIQYLLPNGADVTEQIVATGGFNEITGVDVSPPIPPLSSAIVLQVIIRLPADTPLGSDVFSEILVQKNDSPIAPTIDTVRAVAQNALIVNRETDETADAESLLLGVPDTQPTVPGLQTSLREAINLANQVPGKQIVAFEFPGETTTLQVGTDGLGPLPAITEPIDIDATDGLGLEPNQSRPIELDGRGEIGVGLEIRNPQLQVGDNNRTDITGLAFSNFTETALKASNANILVSQNFIGVGKDGTQATAIQGTGIFAERGELVSVVGNVIANTNRQAVDIVRSKDVQIRGNRIGVRPDNSPAGPHAGIDVSAADSFLIENNFLANGIADSFAVVVVRNAASTPPAGSERTIRNNSVGLLTPRESDAIPRDGIQLLGVSNVVVDQNRIANFDDVGLNIVDTSDITVTGNQIGVLVSDDGTTTTAAGGGVGVRVFGKQENIKIGGPTEKIGSGVGNLVSGNGTNIRIVGSRGSDDTDDSLVEIAGNLIGLSADGMQAASDQSRIGIEVLGSGRVIIGDRAVGVDEPLPQPGNTTRQNVIAGHAGRFGKAILTDRFQSTDLILNPLSIEIVNNIIGGSVNRLTAIENGNGIEIRRGEPVLIQNNQIFASSGDRVVSGFGILKPDLELTDRFGRRVRSLTIDRNSIGPAPRELTDIVGLGNDAALRLESVIQVDIRGNRIAGNEGNTAGGSTIELEGVKDAVLINNVIGLPRRNISLAAIEVSRSENLFIGTPDTAAGPGRGNTIVHEGPAILVNGIQDTLTSTQITIANNFIFSTDQDVNLEPVRSAIVLNGTRNGFATTGLTNVQIVDNEIAPLPDRSLLIGVTVAGTENVFVARNEIRASEGVVVTTNQNTLSNHVRVFQNNFLPVLPAQNLGLPLDLVAANDPATKRTLNDPLDPDNGNNDLQNFPILSRVEQVSVELETPTGFRPERLILVEGFLNSQPQSDLPEGSLYLVEFYPSDSSGRLITDARSARRFSRHRAILVEPEEDGSVEFQHIISGALSNSSLNHLTATATLLQPRENLPGQFDQTTSEFTPPIVITNLETGSAFDLDQDGTPDDIEDLIGRGGADNNGDGIPDRLQPGVAALPESQAVDRSQIDLLAGQVTPPDDRAIAVETPGGSLDGLQIVQADPDALPGNGPAFSPEDGFIHVGAPTNENGQLRFVVTSEIPINLLRKVIRGDQGNVDELQFLELTPDDPGDRGLGITVEFSDDRRKVTVVVIDNGRADFSPEVGFVSDPFQPQLVDGLQLAPAFGALTELVVRRDDDQLVLVDPLSGQIIQSRAISETKVVAVDGALNNGAFSATLDLETDGGFQLRDPAFFLGSPQDDVVTLIGAGVDGSGQAIVFDGDGGRDTLRLGGENQSLNLLQLPDGFVENIEVIQATGTGPNSVVLSPDTVRQITDDRNELLVRANLDDRLELGEGWTVTGTEVVDGQLVRILTNGDTTLRSIGPSEWTNPANRFDVNADGDVTAQDALIVINQLDRTGLLDENGNLPSAGQQGVFTGRFLDVLSRGRFTALDALAVINQLARESRTAEGESLPSTTAFAVAPLIPLVGQQRTTVNQSGHQEGLPMIESNREAIFKSSFFAQPTSSIVLSVQVGGDGTENHEKPDPDQADRLDAIDQAIDLLLLEDSFA